MNEATPSRAISELALGAVPVCLRDHFVGFALALGYCLLLLGTSYGLGMTRDEGFYVDAAQGYAGWFRLLLEHPSAAFTAESVRQFWEYNHEHPALPKSLFALSYLAQERWHIFAADSMAFRFPAMAMAGGTLWVTYILGLRIYGRWAGMFAALALALMPNFFYHAHLNCFDVPIVFFLTWVTYAYLRALESKRWAIITGVLYGLALETKHNAWILPGVLLVHYVWYCAHHWGTRSWRRLFPWWLVAMIAIGVPLFFALWPWLWFDTWPRLQEYVGFHVNHVHYNFAYLGETYWKAPGPIAFPLVMTLFTMPLTVIMLALGGLFDRIGSILPQRLLRRFRNPTWLHGHADSKLTDVLFVGSLIVPLLVIALPNTPKFGGTKHFHAAYPFLALFAGVGFVRVVNYLLHTHQPEFRAIVPARFRDIPNRMPLPAFGLLMLSIVLAPSAQGTWHSHPFGLSYYGFVPGGVPGAADWGMMRQFWGFTTGSLAPWLNEHAAQNATVFICDTVPTSWSMLQRDGVLRRDLGVAWNLESASYAIVHHEHHFVEVDYQIWAVYGNAAPVYVLNYDGVPIISVYKNPRR